MSTRESLQDQLALLEKAHSTRFEDAEEWWTWFMTQKLGLPLEYYNAARMALDQSRWRGVKSPIGYIKRATKYMARKVGLSDPVDRLGLILATDLILGSESVTEALDRVTYASDPLFAMRFSEYWMSKRAKADSIENTTTVKSREGAWRSNVSRELPDPLGPVRRKAGYVADRIGRLLAELKLEEHDPLRGYIVDRMFGFSFSHPSETTRKRFQRMRGRIRQAVLRIASEYEPDYDVE
jgi:hypothetical protein